MVEVKAKCKTRLILNVLHDGEVTTVSQEEIEKAIKKAVREVFIEEDDTLDVKVSIYVQDFSYKDNVDVMRERIMSLLTTAGIDKLEEIEESLK